MIRFSELTERISQDSPPITRKDLVQLERMLDILYGKLGMDVEFGRHFLDRVNDERNKRQITIAELSALFTKEFSKFGNQIADMGVDMEGVLTDLSSDVNVPFVMNWNSKKREMELFSKTVMRKHNFLTRNKKFRVR